MEIFLILNTDPLYYLFFCGIYGIIASNIGILALSKDTRGTSLLDILVVLLQILTWWYTPCSSWLANVVILLHLLYYYTDNVEEYCRILSEDSPLMGSRDIKSLKRNCVLGRYPSDTLPIMYIKELLSSYPDPGYVYGDMMTVIIDKLKHLFIADMLVWCYCLICAIYPEIVSGATDVCLFLLLSWICSVWYVLKIKVLYRTYLEYLKK